MKNHHRRSVRIPEYDYSQAGYYFVTVCTYQHECWLGEIVNQKMQLNTFGELVRKEWLRTQDIRSNVKLDCFVIMPNHLHGIVVIEDNSVRNAGRGTLQRAPTKKPPASEQFGNPTSNSIPTIIRLFKSTTTKQINSIRETPGYSFWQRNYYEHVIRNESELKRVREYIEANPARWDDDQENPNAFTKKE